MFEDIAAVSWTRILAVNKAELGYILLGCLAALVLGAQIPVSVAIISDLIGVGHYLCS